MEGELVVMVVEVVSSYQNVTDSQTNSTIIYTDEGQKSINNLPLLRFPR